MSKTLIIKHNLINVYFINQTVITTVTSGGGSNITIANIFHVQLILIILTISKKVSQCIQDSSSE